MSARHPTGAMRWIFLSLVGLMLLAANAAHAAYSCNVSTAGTGVLYTPGTNQDAKGTVTLNCTRAASDANRLTYRIKADNGLNASGTQRRVRLGATGNRLNYILRKGNASGAANCGNSTNWQAPNNGNGNVMRGRLQFGTALSASATWGYCIRVRGNQGSPSAGTYTDSVQVFAQYPGTNAGALTSVVPLSYTVSVGNECVFNTFPAALSFNYTSFSPAPQISNQNFALRCSSGLFWSLAISPANSPLMGLAYTLAPSPASGTGTGANQTVSLTGTVPANQAGTCATATCSATQVHNVIITY